MYKPTLSNSAYIIGIGPLFIIAIIQALYLSFSIQWVFYPLVALSLYLVFLLLKKTNHLPRPAAEYTDLKTISFSIPIECNASFFTSKEFSKYSFLVRIVEVLSPLTSKKNEPAKIVLNAELANGGDKEFMKIAVCREIERCRTHTQLRITLRLFVPLLLILNLIFSVFVFKTQFDFLRGILFNFFVPISLSALFVLNLAMWNNSLSKHEQRLDKYLLTLFSVESVKKYILKLEELEGSSEKEKYKKINTFYAEQRIKKLDNFKNLQKCS